MTWKIAKLKLHDPDDDAVMYAIVPSDGETAYVVGELTDILELSADLRDFVDAGGTTPCVIDELDPSFGHAWLSTGDAARKYNVPPSTMRSWMENSSHAEKHGNAWYAPEIVIRGWVARWTPHK